MVEARMYVTDKESLAIKKAGENVIVTEQQVRHIVREEIQTTLLDMGLLRRVEGKPWVLAVSER